MFWLIKMFLAFWLLIILITGFATYVGNYNSCDDKGGNYNLTKDGFSCQGADK